MTEAGDWAAVEWSGTGSVFTDVLGRKYLDWLGGFGMMDLGWCHPEVVEAVIAQVKRSPMPSQELIDPLARCAGKTDGRDHAGRSEIFLVCGERDRGD